VAGASRARIRYTAIEHGDCVAITNASTQSCGKRRQKSNPGTLVLYAASQLRATMFAITATLMSRDVSGRANSLSSQLCECPELALRSR
jgi:hypothetical protein